VTLDREKVQAPFVGGEGQFPRPWRAASPHPNPLRPYLSGADCYRELLRINLPRLSEKGFERLSEHGFSRRIGRKRGLTRR
jgi:hypothetical protein